jgi:late competence protein required for DNA uptake (superfamily II DNA/RNA helicase)
MILDFAEAINTFKPLRKYNGNLDCARCGANRLTENEIKEIGCIECEHLEMYEIYDEPA